MALWNWIRIWPTVSDLNEWIWNWQENTNICHIYLVRSCFKRTQVARKFCAKSQRFSTRNYDKSSRNLFCVFLSYSKNKAKISYLIPAHWNASSGKRLSSDTSYMCACSVVFDSLWPYPLYPTRGLCPCDFLARRLEWVAIFSSRRSSQPRDRTHVSCIASRFFTIVPPGKPSRVM